MAQLFQQLSGGGGASNATGLQTQINATRIAADGELSDAHKLSVPSEVDTGHGRVERRHLRVTSAVAGMVFQARLPLLSYTGGAVVGAAAAMSRQGGSIRFGSTFLHAECGHS